MKSACDPCARDICKLPVTFFQKSAGDIKKIRVTNLKKKCHGRFLISRGKKHPVSCSRHMLSEKVDTKFIKNPPLPTPERRQVLDYKSLLSFDLLKDLISVHQTTYVLSELFKKLILPYDIPFCRIFLIKKR